MITPAVLEDYGDVLRMHHCLSHESFSKNKFEYALDRVMKESGVIAMMASRGQKGFDIETSAQKFSLKTELLDAFE